MDISVYDDILADMKVYNSNLSQNYGNTIVGVAPSNPTYPLSIFDEIRNVPYKKYTSSFDKVASLGYKVDIYAKDKGQISKKTIARSLAKELDNYLTNYVKLTQVGWNANENENGGTIYHIIITYTGYLHENRKRLY